MDKEKGRNGMKEKDTKEPAKIEVPLDIALALLRPDELEKLRRYVAAYLMKYGDEEQKNT